MKRICYALLLTLLLTTTSMLTACDDSDDEASETPLLAQTNSSASSDQTLYLAIAGEPTDGYDPTLGWGRYGSPLFQSTLLKRDNDLNIVSDLAESYSTSQDGLTWTVKIRSDVRFSDGTSLTATDVAYTYNTAATSGGRVDITVLDEAVATSDYEVDFHLNEPQITFLYKLATLGIVPAATHDDDYATHPIGSGPYQMIRWDQGQQLIVEANPYYYGQTPRINRLVFLFMDEDASFAAAKAGEVHVVAVPQMMAIQNIDAMTVHPVVSVDNRGLMFPMNPDTGQKSADGYPAGNNVTSDLAIRQAVNYAINRQALVDGILEGFGTPAFGPVSHMPWDEPGVAIEDNAPETARQILADGGWVDSNEDGIVEKDGLKAEFTIIYPASDRVRQSLALAVSDMIQNVGIRVNVEGKSWDEINTLMYSNVILFGFGNLDPTEIYNLYHTSNLHEGYYNAGFYSNQAVDDYLDMAMSATTEADAIPYWQAAQWNGSDVGFTTSGDAAWAWLVNLTHTYFVSDCLNVGQSRVEPHGHGWPLTANIAEWQWTCQ